MERGSELVCIVATADAERKLNKVVECLLKNVRACPLSDEAEIDFEKECVGFKKPGCVECILKNTDSLI